jgi:hypothetical protein
MTASFKQELSMFESIRQGLQDAIDFAEGKPVKAVVHDVSSPDVKTVREYVGMISRSKRSPRASCACASSYST